MSGEATLFAGNALPLPVGWADRRSPTDYAEDPREVRNSRQLEEPFFEKQVMLATLAVLYSPR